MNIPLPSIERLTKLLRLLEASPAELLNSAELSELSGWPRDLIRKDISFLSEPVSTTSQGYLKTSLKEAIETCLGLKNPRRFCIVGLGRLGTAFLKYEGFVRDGFQLVAGFDQSINRIEVLSSTVPLYPSFKMAEVIRTKKIDTALICTPGEAIPKILSQIVPAGIKAILNFSAVLIDAPKDVLVRNVYLLDDLRILSALQQL